MRVVSLACSNTEIVCALGCAELRVGMDDHSDHPKDALQGFPPVGPDLEIDVAKVVPSRKRTRRASLSSGGRTP